MAVLRMTKGRSQAAGLAGKKTKRERRRLDQQVGVNVDEQVSRMFPGELYATVVVRPVNDFLHRKLIIICLKDQEMKKIMI